MSKVDPEQIPAILDAIVGTTGSNGDTYMDDESMSNIPGLEAVCGWVCDRINPAYSGEYPKQCASAEKVAHAVRGASGFILDYMGIDRDALLALADEFDEQAETIARYTESSDGDFDRHAIDAMEEQCGYARRIREALGVDDA